MIRVNLILISLFSALLQIERYSQVKHASCGYNIDFSPILLSWGIRLKEIDATVIITDEESIAEPITELSKNTLYKQVEIDNKHLTQNDT